jgi:hypothetical protein
VTQQPQRARRQQQKCCSGTCHARHHATTHTHTHTACANATTSTHSSSVALERAALAPAPPLLPPLPPSALPPLPDAPAAAAGPAGAAAAAAGASATACCPLAPPALPPPAACGAAAGAAAAATQGCCSSSPAVERCRGSTCVVRASRAGTGTEHVWAVVEQAARSGDMPMAAPATNHAALLPTLKHLSRKSAAAALSPGGRGGPLHTARRCAAGAAWRVGAAVSQGVARHACPRTPACRQHTTQRLTHARTWWWL